jgi:hypothetical protein
MSTFLRERERERESYIAHLISEVDYHEVVKTKYRPVLLIRKELKCKRHYKLCYLLHIAKDSQDSVINASRCITL